VYANLYITGTTDMVVNKKPVRIIQEHNYPWQGNLKFTLSPASATDFALLLRLPGWARNEASPGGLYRFATPTAQPISIRVNGKPLAYTTRQGYAVLSRKWRKNDVVEMTLPMEVQQVKAHSKVQDNVGKVALQRGPVVYCAEWKDNAGKASNIIVPAATTFTAAYQPDLLNGIMQLMATVPTVQVDAASHTISTQRQTLTAIPYYAWANRGKGERAGQEGAKSTLC
jgi:DUF1680 family protein